MNPGSPEGLICDEGHDDRHGSGCQRCLNGPDPTVVYGSPCKGQDEVMGDGIGHEHIVIEHVRGNGQAAQSGSYEGTRSGPADTAHHRPCSGDWIPGSH